MTALDMFKRELDAFDAERKARRQRLVVHLLARLVLFVISGVALLATGAPSWAFVLALISATYWGPPRLPGDQ